ncbi:MAG: hypothetical protein U1F04_05755 [Burkholderiaceae bacterium]
MPELAQQQAPPALGLRQRVSRSTLADANERRDAVLFEALGQRLTEMALALYQDHDIGLGLQERQHAVGCTIDLCLSLFAWADFDPESGIRPHRDRSARLRPVMLSTDSKDR